MFQHFFIFQIIVFSKLKKSERWPTVKYYLLLKLVEETVPDTDVAMFICDIVVDKVKTGRYHFHAFEFWTHIPAGVVYSKFCPFWNVQQEKNGSLSKQVIGCGLIHLWNSFRNIQINLVDEDNFLICTKIKKNFIFYLLELDAYTLVLYLFSHNSTVIIHLHFNKK